MVMKMKRFGSSLSTRQTGRAAFIEIDRFLNGSDLQLVFDFSGVTSVTNSFADEVFGRLIAQRGFDTIRARTHFKNLDQISAMVIRNAIESHREKLLATA